MRLFDLKEAWASGAFADDPVEETRAQAEAENLAFTIGLKYEDIDSFYINSGRKKEPEDVISSAE